MRKPLDPDRVLHAARALALTQGQFWRSLDPAIQTQYLDEAGSMLIAVAEYDARKHSMAVVEGKKRSTKVKQSRIPLQTEEMVRKMLREQADYRAIRSETGLGSSTIHRIKQGMEKTRVSYNSPGPGRAAANGS